MRKPIGSNKGTNRVPTGYKQGHANTPQQASMISRRLFGGCSYPARSPPLPPLSPLSTGYDQGTNKGPTRYQQGFNKGPTRHQQGAKRIQQRTSRYSPVIDSACTVWQLLAVPGATARRAVERRADDVPRQSYAQLQRASRRAVLDGHKLVFLNRLYREATNQ